VYLLAGFPRFTKNPTSEEADMTSPILATLSRLFPHEDSQDCSRANKAYSHDLKFLKERGTVVQVIQPGQRGRIAYQSTTWFAACPYHVVLFPDTPVRVIGRRNTTLIVEPVIFTASWL
jgi:membrane protein implicated in regulation of membrane protease activity